MLLDTLATFTSTEIMSYKDFVRYVILTATLTLERPEFKEKVLESPEILEVIDEIPHVKQFASSFYYSQYEPFFISLAEIENTMGRDIYLHDHVNYYAREMRIRAYAQVLESYKSVSMQSLASQFGVSQEWLDT